MMHFKKFAFGCFVASSIVCSMLLSVLVWTDLPASVRVVPHKVVECVKNIPTTTKCPIFKK